MSTLEELRPPGGWYRGAAPVRRPAAPAQRARARRGFDPEPLLARFHGQPDTEVARRLGVARETVNRWRQGHHHVSLGLADQAANELGLHPVNLWPEKWGAA